MCRSLTMSCLRGARWRRWAQCSSLVAKPAGADGSAQLVDQGLCKSIGISNFNINRTKKLLKDVRIKPVVSALGLPSK